MFFVSCLLSVCVMKYSVFRLDYRLHPGLVLPFKDRRLWTPGERSCSLRKGGWKGSLFLKIRITKIGFSFFKIYISECFCTHTFFRIGFLIDHDIYFQNVMRIDSVKTGVNWIFQFFLSIKPLENAKNMSIFDIA